MHPLYALTAIYQWFRNWNLSRLAYVRSLVSNSLKKVHCQVNYKNWIELNILSDESFHKKSGPLSDIDVDRLRNHAQTDQASC